NLLDISFTKETSIYLFLLVAFVYPDNVVATKSQPEFEANLASSKFAISPIINIVGYFFLIRLIISGNVSPLGLLLPVASNASMSAPDSITAAALSNVGVM